MRLHRTARKRLHNRVVGDIELTGNALELPGDDLTLIAYTADAGSPGRGPAAAARHLGRHPARRAAHDSDPAAPTTATDRGLTCLSCSPTSATTERNEMHHA